ncbi:hypothetical protein JM93_02324 [Roseibium hamelinense]|uniref:Methyltransferase family protein n=1 Tax=Roseibium hamelinense TaxID=150831 RepID=A0A562T0L8_9HYPH|nr:hypothetical protein [Roseibium hamelinense]MTI43828.1 hypothetical protein [Roseibium hamelinense]TWI87087.1 hypothetical protein JM93_02324 [Roseibium hamelinense]
MSGFSAEWLALREPVDIVARSREVEDVFLSQLAGSGPLLDLASGAGSTVAAMNDRVSSESGWILCDNDPALLGVAHNRFSETNELEIRHVDLATSLNELPFDTVSGVTTSAFLDLVTEAFLEQLVRAVVGSKKPFLASLTYDGRAWCEPPDPMDAVVTKAMNLHQKTDKGFGVALGPDAPQVAERLFRDAGYEVVTQTSDWAAGAADSAFLKELIAGWTTVGTEVLQEPERVHVWRDRRRTEIDRGVLTVGVGHIDLAAYPAG